MFLLYHSEGCNICEMEFHKCYINDLRTTTCSGMLGHRTPFFGLTVDHGGRLLLGGMVVVGGWIG
jgi:hypothetical protein